jgi:signal transduction histidine kinase
MMGDLHDGLGLHLVAALRQARSPETPREAVAESLQDCMDDLRVAIDSLDEVEREPVALLASLRFRLAPRFEALGIRLRWHVCGQIPTLTLDAEGALHLLRIVQEALTNALKHGSMQEVHMSVTAEGPAVVVTVADDGPGFDAETVRRGRGLAQMQMRAAKLGAQIQFSAGVTGSLTRLILPCPRRASAEPG